jgi:hypothetical protein
MSIRFHFNPEKSTQLAAYLLKKASGSSMSKYVLLKMIYLADREALRRWDLPITGDEPVSMELGPVPSRIYDLTKGGVRFAEIWGSAIATSGKRVVFLKSDPGRDELSDSELKLLDGIWKQFGTFSFEEMKAYCHKLPEYDQNVGKGSRPIRFEALLSLIGKNQEQIQKIADSEREESFLRDAVGA